MASMVDRVYRSGFERASNPRRQLTADSSQHCGHVLTARRQLGAIERRAERS
jgi:hypothetical protein